MLYPAELRGRWREDTTLAPALSPLRETGGFLNAPLCDGWRRGAGGGARCAMPQRIW
jgi:hypothetical protein